MKPDVSDSAARMIADFLARYNKRFKTKKKMVILRNPGTGSTGPSAEEIRAKKMSNLEKLAQQIAAKRKVKTKFRKRKRFRKAKVKVKHTPRIVPRVPAPFMPILKAGGPQASAEDIASEAATTADAEKAAAEAAASRI